jgi:hypothetical protein
VCVGGDWGATGDSEHGMGFSSRTTLAPLNDDLIFSDYSSEALKVREWYINYVSFFFLGQSPELGGAPPVY